MDNSEDEFISYLQKILILRVIQQIFREMLIGGRFFHADSFFEATNVRKNVKNRSSEFEGLLKKMVSNKPFINQEKSYINGNGEMKISTVSAYIKEFFSIL